MGLVDRWVGDVGWGPGGCWIVSWARGLGGHLADGGLEC